MVLDKATGELVERATFQAYGGSESDYRPERWNAFREDYRFTGKEEDVEVGLQYFGKRYLNPLLGRWISADPLAVHAPGEADLNLYAYVSGQVLKNVDPLGLDEEDGGQAGGSESTPGSNEDALVARWEAENSEDPFLEDYNPNSNYVESMTARRSELLDEYKLRQQALQDAYNQGDGVYQAEVAALRAEIKNESQQDPGLRNLAAEGLHPSLALAGLYMRRILRETAPVVADNSRVGRTAVSSAGQQAVYDKGRSVPNREQAGKGNCPASGIGAGCTVTDARPGRSLHNWGLAIDHDIWDPLTKRQEGAFVVAAQEVVAEVMLEMDPRMEWGIDFMKGKIRDRPHFQNKDRAPTATQAIQRAQGGDEVIHDTEY